MVFELFSILKSPKKILILNICDEITVSQLYVDQFCFQLKGHSNDAFSELNFENSIILDWKKLGIFLMISNVTWQIMSQNSK